MRRTRQKVNSHGIFIILIMMIVSITLITIFAESTSSNDCVSSYAESKVEMLEATPISFAPDTATHEPCIEYKSLGDFTLTAYCPCVRCCGEWSAEHPSKVGTDYIQKTASGVIPAQGRTISVDTKLIPFGTAVVINGHEYIAEDRGGAIKGNTIDIYFDSHEEALEFGRQTAEVFIEIIKED